MVSKKLSKFVALLVMVFGVAVGNLQAQINLSSPSSNYTVDFCAAGAVTFDIPIVATTVNAGIGCTISYEWYLGSVSAANKISAGGSPAYANVNTSSLKVGAAHNLASTSVFYAVLTEVGGACNATITVGPLTYIKVSAVPTITINSSAVDFTKDVCQNETATFTAAVSAPSPAGVITYNWYKKPFGGANALVQTTASTTSTSDVYEYKAFWKADQDEVYYTATNACGTSTSKVGTLNVNSKPIVSVPVGMSTITACEGAGFNVTYNIDTATYGNRAGNINWSLTPSGGSSAALSALLTKTGAGNTTVNLVGIGAALTPGTYEVTFTTATNTDDGCARTIATNSINVTIYPKPVIEFSAVPAANICDVTGTTSFKIKVTNAEYTANGSTVKVNWSAGITQSSKSIAAANCAGTANANILPTTLTGTGNGEFTYAVNGSSLSPGSYSYTLTGISNTSNSCTGTLGATTNVAWDVNPTPSVSVQPASTSVCQGVGSSYNVNVTNARYCVAGVATDIDWSLSFTDQTTSNIGGTPLVGTGNKTGGTVLNFTIPGTLTEGTYVFTPGTITNTTHATACAKTITGNTFTLTVNPTPKVTFSTAAITQCEGTAGTTFDMIVSNATLNGVNQNWTVNYSADGASALGGTPCAAGATAGIITGGQTGSGNVTRQFTIPSNLAPGYYTYTLNSVSNTSSGCTYSPAANSVGAVGTITIIIEPAPRITMNPDIKTVCENLGESFNLQITNTKGCSAIGAANVYNADWTINSVTDNANSNLTTAFGSYPNGNGNQTYSIDVDVAKTLSPNNHTLTASVQNTNGGTTCAAGSKTTDIFTLSVDPRPEIKIDNSASATVTHHVCEGTASSFTFEVSNAQQNGVDVNWEVTYTESSGMVKNANCSNAAAASQADLPGASGAYTGKGNGTSTITIPSNLPVGRYTYTLSNIQNTDAPCTGTVNGVQFGSQTVVINVYPKPTMQVNPAAGEVCENSVKTNAFELTVSNATYCSAANTRSNVSWSISRTDNVLSNAPIPITGSGNTTVSYNANTAPSTLAPGKHTFTIDALTTTGLPTNCTGTVVGGKDEYELTVNPTPTAEFASATVNVCEGETGSFSVLIGNATLSGNPVNWTLTTSESSGNIVANCINGNSSKKTLIPVSSNGSGNKAGTSLSYTIPNTLEPGRYTYTITGITNTDATPDCNGTIGATNTIVINVFPKPTYTMASASKVCEGSTKVDAVNINVTNAEYCSAVNTKSPVGWEIAYTDNIESSLLGGALTGSGNGNTKYDGNAILAPGLSPGQYTFETTSIKTTGLATTCTNNLADVYKLTVNPTPLTGFVNKNVTVCEGSTGKIGIYVSNAELLGNGVNWSLTTTETSGNLPTSCLVKASANAGILNATITGKGNKSGTDLEFTIPSTLAPGIYTYTIHTIKNTDENCDGFVTFADQTVTVYVYPKIAVAFDKNSGEACEGDNTTFKMEVTNARYCTALNTAADNSPWEMAYTDGLNSDLFPNPLTGSGNSTITVKTNDGGLLAAGIYEFSASKIQAKITTPTAGTCETTLTNKYTLTVNPEPIASFSTSNLNVCEGAGGTFDIQVSNATVGVGGTALNWEIDLVGDSANIGSSCNSLAGTASGFGSLNTSGTADVTGTGNKTITVAVPTNLKVGVYVFTINSITNIASPCTGVVGTNPTITIVVQPKPIVILDTDKLTVCENTTEDVDITVSNAQYCGSVGGAPIDVNWEITHTDATAGNIPGSIWSGTGNVAATTYTVNTGATLTAGGSPYTFVVNKVENITHGCVTNSPANNTLTVTVNDLPTLVINSVTPNICLNTKATITYTVSDLTSNTDAWSFTFSDPAGGPYTVTGVGPKTGTVETSAFSTSGAKTITYTAITNTTTGCIGNTPGNSNTNVLLLPDVTSFTHTTSPNICNALTNDYNVNVINSAGKTWKITYSIAGGADETWTGTGNGVHTRPIPTQYLAAGANVETDRAIKISKIEWTGSTPNCENLDVTDKDANVVVRPRPYVTLIAPDSVCVNSIATVEYNVGGLDAGKNWDFDWYTTNPTDGPNQILGVGPKTAATFNTLSLAPVGTSTVTVGYIINTTTGCDSSYAWKEEIRVDPPTVPGTLSKSYTICDGDKGPYTFNLTGHTGHVVNWDSSENLTYIWHNIGNAGKTSYTVTSPTSTRNYQVKVKSGACPADSSNDVILFVHPQPSVSLVSVTDSVCRGTDIKVVYDVTGVPNTNDYTVDYTMKIGSAAATNGTWTGTGSGATKTATVATTGGAFPTTGNVDVVFTITKITNNKTGCDTTLTSSLTSRVKNAPVGKAATENQTLCQNSNGIVTWTGTELDGYVVGWEKKVGSGSWSTIAGSAGDTLEFVGLTTTTYFRAKIENYPCSGYAYSTPDTITIIATNPTAEFISSSKGAVYCASPTDKVVLRYDVSGTNGNTWKLTILEGSKTSVVTGTGDVTGKGFVTTAGNMLSTFSVTLLKLEILSGSTTCTKNLDNTAMAVITIIDMPAASINSVTSPVCSGSDITASFNVSNIKSSEKWTLVYTVAGVSYSTSGTGPGNFTVNHTVTGNNVNQNLVLTSITNTTTKNTAGSTCTNTLSGQSATYAVRGATIPGTIGSNATVCKGATGTISETAASTNGSVIIGWMSRTWTGSTWTSWTSTGNTSNSQAYVNLNNTTEYYAVYANSPCNSANSNTITITVLELPIATISLTTGNDTICEGGTTVVTVNTQNMTAGQTFTLNYTEGSTTKSVNLVNTAPITFTTGVITTTTNIQLISVSTTSGVTCTNSSLSSTVNVVVQPKPTGTIASFDNLLCHGSTVNYSLTIGNLGTTDKWVASLTLDGSAETLTGTGTGTFSGTTTNTVTSTSDNLILVSVKNTSTQDQCISNINQTKTISVSAKTVAGTIGTSTSVCKGSSGSVTQTASGTGALESWLTRTYNGSAWGSWSVIANNSTTQSYVNLQNTTQYRAVYKNNPCDTVHSSAVTITVLELPTGTLSLSSGNDTICESAVAVVTVNVSNIATGQTFRIDYTEGSSTKAVNFTKVAGQSAYTFTTGKLTSTTVISIDKIATTSGVTCSNTTLNSSVTVTVQELPTATIASADKVLCHGQTVNYTIAVGNTGSNDNWTLNLKLDANNETVNGKGTGTFSFTTTNTVTATSDLLSLVKITNNSTQDGCYRETFTNGTKTISVDTTTVPGVIGTSKISTDTTICKGASAQLVQYKNGVGNIVKWQSRVKSSSTWVDIVSTGTVLNVYNQQDTTYYRAAYLNGVCLTSLSNVVAVNPKKLPLAIINKIVDDSICAGTTSDFEVTVTNVAVGQNFKLSYKEGSVSRTQSLTQNASGVHTLTTGTLTTTSQIQLTSIFVTSGHPQCSDSLTSNGTVTVLSLPFATITSGPDTLCQAEKIVFTVNVSNVLSSDKWRLIYELENDKDTISGTGPGNFSHVDTDANTAESAKIQLVEILNLSNVGQCKSVNTDDWDIYIYKPTQAGTIGSNDTICKGSSTIIKEVVGTPKQGVTVSWEYKPSSASNWTALSNSNTTLNILNLQETTSYRAIYKSGVCDTAHSNVIKIEVRELPLATISAGSTTICAGDSTNLTVNISNVGSTQTWSIEYLVGTQIAYMTGTGGGNKTLRVGNFITTSDVVLREISTTSGIPMCTNNKLTTNAKATVNVNSRPYASLNGVNSPVCQNSTSSFTVTVGNVRSGDKWTLTYDVKDAVAGATYSGSGPGTVTINTPSLTTAKTYVVNLLNIKNNTTSCDSNLTATMNIVVDATTVAGSVTSDTTVCYADHVGTVRHSGGNGSIIRWETSQDNGTSWATISNTASNYTYNNLTKTSLFRAVKRNGNVCAEASTSPITVTVNALPVASISGSNTICANTSGNLTVSVTNAQNQSWMVSYLVGSRLDTLAVSGPSTSATLNTGTLSKTTDVTLRKVWMTSGKPQCLNDNLTNNATATVEVNDLPNGRLISLTDSVCTGTPAYGKATITGARSYEGWKMYWSINGGANDSASGTGSGSFNFTTANLTVNPSTLKLVRIVNTTTGCSFALSDQDQVIVSPLTVGGTLAGVDTVCQGSNSGTLTLGADARGTVLGWEYSTDNGSTWTAISNTKSTYTYSNITKTTVFRVSVKNGACDQKYSSTVTIVVNQAPIATIAKVGASSICSGSSTYVALDITNVKSGATWVLTYLEGSTVKTITGTGSGKDTIFTSVLKSTTSITLQSMTITAGAPQCTNASFTNNYTTTISIIDNPTATFTSYPSVICKGTTPTVTILVDDVKGGEAWTAVYKVNNGASLTSTGVGKGQFNLSNMPSFTKEGMNGLRLVSITNTSTSPNCTKALTDSITIQVDSTSLGGTVSGIAKVCKGSNGALVLKGRRGDVQKWQYSVDGINYYDIANTTDSLRVTGLTAKTWYRAVVMYGVCSSTTSSVHIIDIQELPTVTITNATQNICSGSTATVNMNIGNVLSTDTWTLTYKENGTNKTYSAGSGTTGSIVFGPYSSTTTIEITGIQLTSGLGCTNTISEKAVITVTPNPTATITAVPDSMCNGDVLTFTVSVDNVATGSGWSLDYDVDGVAAATKKGNGSGTFTVNSSRTVTPTSTKLKLTNIALSTGLGCSSVLNDSATIKVSPTSVGGTLSPASTTVCKGASAGLTLTGETGAVQNWEYSTDGGVTWTVTANRTKTLAVTNIGQTTLYRVFVKSGTCKGAYSTVATITVVPTPEATVTSNAKVCPGDLATFTLHVSNVAAGNGWSVIYKRNGVVSGTPVTGTGSGDFAFTVTGGAYTGNPSLITVELVSITNTTFGCANTGLTSSASARITPNPIANFTASNDCKDSVIVFKNTSTLAEGNITTYKWYFGDGDSSLNGSTTHAYTAAGTYNARLVVWSDNGCRGEVTKAVTVYPNPIANFTMSNVCKNAEFAPKDASTVASGNIVSWSWTFGDGATSALQNPTHTYASSGNFDVTLKVTTNNGCTHTITKTVVVYILPEANFVAAPVCENTPMAFVNSSAIGYGTMTYDWNFASQGNATDKDPSFTFTGFGTFNTRLIAISNNGCRDTINRNVTVYPQPTSSFTVAPACIGDVTTFVNTSTVPTGALVEYFWDFGDFNFSGLKNPTHTYATPGSYDVTLRVKSGFGCENSSTAKADVIALPTVDLTANGPTEFCDGDSVVLSANVNARTYAWSWTGGGTSTNATVTAKTTGWYKVRITAPPIGCANEDSIFINVWPLPDAKAWPREKVGQNVDTISKGQSIVLHASGGVNYTWNPITFLNPTTGEEVTAERVTETTKYTVTVTDINGCVNTADVTVIVLDNWDLLVYNAVTPNGDGMNDTWIIENIWAYPNAEVIIFNRYGMEVYRQTGYDNSWDATYKGDPLPDGPYYYVIVNSDFPEVYKGVINVIRERK